MDRLRFNRYLFSSNREHRLKWPDLKAEAPQFIFTPPSPGEGPIALVLSISAEIASRDIFKALPNARIATLTIAEPSYAMVRNRRVIHAFRDVLQIQLSRLEAQTLEEIHIFAAIPAALAIELGALLTTQHQHSYAVYDRDETEENGFQRILRNRLQVTFYVPNSCMACALYFPYFSQESTFIPSLQLSNHKLA